MHASSEASIREKTGRNRWNSLPDDDQQRLTRASSLWVLSATAGEAEEVAEELGENEGEEMANMSSGGLQCLFMEEEDDVNEFQFRRVPRVNNQDEVQMLRKVYE